MKLLMENWRGFLKEEEQQTLTVGELRDMVEILSSQEDKNAKKAKLKKLGGIVFKLGASMVPVIGGILAVGVEVGDNIASIFGAITDPKAINQGKIKNEPWVRMLGIDTEFSKIIDDGIEDEFLKMYISKYTKGIMAANPDAPLPNFTDELAKYINKTKVKTSPMSISKK